MNGQSLITIIRPMDVALEDLAEDSDDEASFIAQANVSADGNYALVSSPKITKSITRFKSFSATVRPG